MAKVDGKKLERSGSTNGLIYSMIGIGAVSFMAALATDASRAWFTYLLFHSLFMGLAVGALFFLVIHYLSSSGWIVAVRRIPEAMASYMVIAFLFNIILMFGLKKIYPWTNHEYMAADHILHGKIGYFSNGFFAIRMVAFYLVACFFSCKLICNSISQDKEGGVDRSHRQKTLSALFLVLFCPVFTVFSVDLIKSLDPKWFSTMWGVYVLIGFVQASIAAMIVIIRKMQKHGYMSFVSADHFHDLGKYLFGFTIFWAYIAVSQYLLIWYANLPEEITFFLSRQTPGWVAVSLLLPALRFVLPFLLLLPRMAKRTGSYLEKVSYLVLVGAWVDLVWMIMPAFSPAGFKFGWQDIGVFLGFLGVFCLVVRSFLAKNATIPVKDPYLHETLHHHVM